MYYNDVLKRINNYFYLEDFSLDDKYISIKKLDEIIKTRVFDLFFINNINLPNKYCVNMLNSMGIYIDKKETRLVLYTNQINIVIAKERNEEAYIVNSNIPNDLLNSIHSIADIINERLEKLEKLYDTLKVENQVTDVSDLKLIENDEGFFCCYDDHFIKIILDIYTYSCDIKYDFSNDECYNMKYKNILGKGRIIDLLNDSREFLDNKIKIRINHLPEKLKLLINDELNKEKKDVKVLKKYKDTK